MVLRTRQLVWTGLWMLLAPLAVAEAGLDAESVIARAHAAAGGAAWTRPRTLHLVGTATLYRDGRRDAAIHADHYEMWRVFPDWNEAAHGANGKFRLEARAGDRVLIRTSFDGVDTWGPEGRVPAAEASREWSENFGFGIIRFALDDGFGRTLLADDTVDGHDCHVVQVTDPSGGETTFWIDRETFAIRKVGFDTPRGWHERIYSDFFRVEPPGFVQPGRVRLYYRGAKVNDIRWTTATVDAPIDDAIFVLDPR